MGQKEINGIGEHTNIASLAKAQTTDSNQIEIPQMELPRGGGAIKGIDEKFKVNPSNGTASLSIPLPITPGRGGFSPTIGLSYNSGGGNGLFGLGWSLGLPSITRKTDKKIPRYTDDDVFMLSGAEDLVPFKVETTPGEWETKATTEGDYTITRYRSRLTSDHARIEKIAHPTEGTYWRATTADNRTTFFGNDENSRLSDPADANKIFTWLPSFSYDNLGNWISYEYKAEDLTNVQNTVNEKNRFNGNQLFANKYLKRVRYGNATPYFPDALAPYDPPMPVDNAHFFELVFDYGEHDLNIPTPSETLSWKARKDSFSRYRSGFEIRTFRLCERVLMFHHFPNEKQQGGSVFGSDYLVKSLDFNYTESAMAEVTYITSIQQKGYVRKADGSYSTKTLPPMEFEYQELEWHTEIKTISSQELENMPTGLTGNYQWVDLYGEGISGLLTEQGEGWFYKHNLGNLEEDGQVAFQAIKQVAPKPSYHGLDPGVLSLVDLEADGQKQIVLQQGGRSGYFELNEDESWEPFQAFESRINLDLSDSNTRIFDLNGDGKADLVITEENAITFYASDGKKGYKDRESALKPFDEEQGPAIVFADQKNAIFLADMSGDGLTDIVRIRNGEVCYWANLGYGNFSAKVTMANSPWFDHPDHFNPKHLHISDISGTGAADIIYNGKNTFQGYINLSGNALSDVQQIDPFFPVDHMVAVQTTDLLGTGTSCLVWSSALPGDKELPLRYIDLMGGLKPHVMTQYSNNFGKTTRMEYRSSTYFYLKDKLEGKPWITKLPFPVQVVEKMTMEDAITEVKFSTQYIYHHGYYDHPEREFRGFGMVESMDSEQYTEWKDENADNQLEKEEVFFQKPVLTRTWYHTGAFLGKENILNHFRSEYWQEEYEVQFPGELGASVEPTLDDAVVKPAGHILDNELISKLNAQEHREISRACKGMVLRREIFALDAPEISPSDEALKKQLTPYSVAAHNCQVILQQPQLDNLHACFQVLESEVFTIAYERNIDDPRITHKINTKIDRYGNVLEAASIAYVRKNIAPALPQQVKDEQGKTAIIYTKNQYTNEVEDVLHHRLPMLCETETYEITDLNKASDYYTLDDFDDILDTGSMEIAYHDSPSKGTTERRKIEHSRSIFYKDDLTGPLGPGILESRGFLYESYLLALTPVMFSDLYSGKITDANLPENEGYYFHSQGDANWWISSGRTVFLAAGESDTDAANRFFTPQSYLDPTGAEVRVEYYKNYSLFLDKITDPLGNEASVEQYNFRTLSPTLLRDANENLTGVVLDELGLPKASAMLGKDLDKDGVAELEVADNLTHITEWSEDETAAIEAFFLEKDSNALHSAAANLLQQATTRYLYDFEAFINKKPTVTAAIKREIHHAHLGVGEESPLQLSFEYTGGMGNLVMTKLQAEPGIAKEVTVAPDDTYVVMEVDTGSQLRWLGNGRTVWNNKGNLVKQYEPFFSTSPQYESLPELVETGVTPVFYYDSLSRHIKTEFPDQTFVEVHFSPWEKIIYDQNDTAGESLWYENRINHLIDAELLAEGKDPDKEATAAAKTEAHFDTPSTVYFDVLGRPIHTIAHNNKTDGTDEFIHTSIRLDIEGNTLSVTDARGNTVMHYRHDMLGHRVYQNSIDSGERWAFFNALLKPIYTWDSRSHKISISYDALQRVLEKRVEGGDGATPLNHVFEYNIYGENATNDKQNNLRGQLYQNYDTAGKTEIPQYDHKGNMVKQIRKFSADYKTVVNWTGADLDDMLEMGDGKETAFTYDALNRIRSKTCPDNSLVINTYNEAGLLDQVEVTQQGNTQLYVKNIDYNEKGQREAIQYGNEVKTTYRYDKETFSLLHLQSKRENGDLLQDLYYTYDPVGNITEIEDKAIPTIFFDNQIVTPRNKYTYDAIYQLIEAEGKEHVTQVNHHSCDHWNDLPFLKQYDPNDPLQWRNYTQRYQYDEVGNITQMRHLATNGNWTRDYSYGATNNHLISTTVGAQTYSYSHHPQHGFITQVPHLQGMDWNFKDELVATTTQSVCTGLTPETTYYVYDGKGQRVRKITENQAQGDNSPTMKEERQYIGDIEVYKKVTGNHAGLERITLHLSDNQGRIAMIDTRNEVDDGTDIKTSRYQLGSHNQSAALELDAQAEIISYEEYHPYGTTAYQAVSKTIKAAAKRYRYTGMERDEETGLAYHGARYYLPWLGRWLSADPIGIGDGVNLYVYTRNNPVRFVDPGGTNCDPSIMSCPEDDIYFDELEAQMSIPEEEPTPPNATTWMDDESTPLSEDERGVQSLGIGIVGTYNSAQRLRYIKEIKQSSQEALDTISEARLVNDIDLAETATKKASSTRDFLRTATQKRLPPGAAKMSEALEQPRTWESLIEDPKYKRTNPMDTLENVAEASGRSRTSVKYLAKGGGVLGPASTVYGAYVVEEAISNASPEERPEVIAEEAGGIVGGAIGYEIGTAAGVGTAGIIAGGLGMSGPPGWLVLALGIGGGIAGGVAGSEGGRALGKATYEQAEVAIGYVGMAADYAMSPITSFIAAQEQKINELIGDYMEWRMNPY